MIGSPLSEDDRLELEHYLDEHGKLDIEGMLGLMNAVGVAPGMIPPSRWIPAVLGDEPVGSPEAFERNVGLLLRFYNEVIEGLDTRNVFMPDPDLLDEMKRFAAGYVQGALLDPEWGGDEQRWSFAAPFARLAGEDDLVPGGMGNSPVEDICEDAELLILAAEGAFKEVRMQLLGGSNARAPARSSRVGRNEPCPCGSGKKYKKCCGAPGAA